MKLGMKLGMCFTVLEDSQDTEDTAYSCIFILSLIHFQAVLSSENVSVVSKDTEDTALHVFVSYLRYI